MQGPAPSSNRPVRAKCSTPGQRLPQRTCSEVALCPSNSYALLHSTHLSEIDGFTLPLTYPRCPCALEAQVCLPESLYVVDVVPQGSEPHFPIFACCLPYPSQFMLQDCPTLRPGPDLLGRVPLGQPPFLHRLRRAWRTIPFVRRLLRYYGVVRLPACIHLHYFLSVLLCGPGTICSGHTQDLPVPVRGVSVRAWGLRPRGVRASLTHSG